MPNDNVPILVTNNNIISIFDKLFLILVIIKVIINVLAINRYKMNDIYANRLISDDTFIKKIVNAINDVKNPTIIKVRLNKVILHISNF